MIFAGVMLMAQVVAGATGQPPLSVRAGERVSTVAVRTHPDGGSAVAAGALAQALGGQLVAAAGPERKWRLEVGTRGIDLEPGGRFALSDADTLPLTEPAFRVGSVLYVPLSLAVELLPRLGAGVLYDAQKRELRRFVPVVSSGQRAGTGTAANRQSSAAPAGTTPMGRAAGSATAQSHATARKHVVIVDAGHGGPDNGMSGPIGAARKVYEKNITLSLSRKLAAELEKRGVTVVMTRTRDTLIALRDRGRIANQAKGDVFVSIHVNAANPKWNNPGGARGFETYFLAEAKTEDERRVEAMENESIRFETSVDASRDDPLGFIIRDMAQNEHLRESSRLATLIQSGLKEVHPGTNRGVKQAGFAVLVTAFMPAVLVEVGFGSNRADADYMTSTKGQNELSVSIADAVMRYLAEYERKVGGQ